MYAQYTDRGKVVYSMMRMKKSIVLVGMPGCGKSTVGRALSHMVQTTFVDSDREIERQAKKTISEIFSHYGEAYFRCKERQVIKRLVVLDPIVLALGGGAYIDERTRRIVQKNTVVVWLKVDFSHLWNRVRTKKFRPLLNGPRAKDNLRRQWEQRTPIYSRAHIEVSCGYRTVHSVAREVARRLKNHKNTVVRGEIEDV